MDNNILGCLKWTFVTSGGKFENYDRMRESKERWSFGSSKKEYTTIHSVPVKEYESEWRYSERAIELDILLLQTR